MENDMILKVTPTTATGEASLPMLITFGEGGFDMIVQRQVSEGVYSFFTKAEWLKHVDYDKVRRGKEKLDGLFILESFDTIYAMIKGIQLSKDIN
jgi:hypothetical protein